MLDVAKDVFKEEFDIGLPRQLMKQKSILYQLHTLLLSMLIVDLNNDNIAQLSSLQEGMSNIFSLKIDNKILLEHAIDKNLAPNIIAMVAQFSGDDDEVVATILRYDSEHQSTIYTSNFLRYYPRFQPSVSLIKTLIRDNQHQALSILRIQHGYEPLSEKTVDERTGRNFVQYVVYKIRRFFSFIAPYPRSGLTLFHYAHAHGANEQTIQALRGLYRLDDGIENIRDKNHRRPVEFNSSDIALVNRIFPVSLARASQVTDEHVLRGALDSTNAEISKTKTLLERYFYTYAAQNNSARVAEIIKTCPDIVGRLNIINLINDYDVSIFKVIVAYVPVDTGILNYAFSLPELDKSKAFVDAILATKFKPDFEYVSNLIREGTLWKLQSLKNHGYDFTQTSGWLWSSKSKSLLDVAVEGDRPPLHVIAFLLQSGFNNHKITNAMLLNPQHQHKINRAKNMSAQEMDECERQYKNNRLEIISVEERKDDPQQITARHR